MTDAIHYTKEVAKGSLWSLAGSAVFYFISFFYVILIARAMSQDDLGLFFLAMSVVSAGAILDNLGLSSAIARYIPYFEGKGETGKIRSLLKMSYSVATATSLLLLLILWVFSDFIASIFQNPPLGHTIRMLSAFLLLSNILNLNVAYLRGRADIRSMQLSSTTQNFLKLTLTAAFFWLFGATVAALIAAFLLSLFFSILFSFVFVKKDMEGLLKDKSSIPLSEIIKEILPFGLMVSFVHSLGAIFISANRLLLGYLIDPSESTQVIAIYTVAATLSAVIMALPTSIGSIFLPLMSRLYGKGELDKMRSVTETAQRWSLFITIPAGLIMILFSGDILATVYGDAYRAGGTVMSILTFGFLVGMVSYMLSLTLIAMRLVMVQLKIVLVSGIANVIMSIILIPLIGMTGSAVGSVVGFFFTVLLLNRYAGKHFGFRMPPAVFKLGVAGLISLAIVSLLSPYSYVLISFFPDVNGGDLYLSKLVFLSYLAALAMLSLAIFMTISLMLKCFRKEDIVLIRKAMHKANMPTFAINVMEKVASYGISP
jgi:O-antigen/teichoic acid export membrane protein